MTPQSLAIWLHGSPASGDTTTPALNVEGITIAPVRSGRKPHGERRYEPPTDSARLALYTASLGAQPKDPAQSKNSVCLSPIIREEILELAASHRDPARLYAV
jgi:hypothetical protein